MAKDCLLWHKACTRAGYGVTTVASKTKYVHRLAMEKKIGRALGSKEFVCHSCDTPACYNIDHLFLGTQGDNMADAKAKGRMAKGFGLPQTRLSGSDVAGIVWFCAAGVWLKHVARLYRVDPSHVSKIVGGHRRLVLEG
jgi:hypothetical protein